MFISFVVFWLILLWFIIPRVTINNIASNLHSINYGITQSFTNFSIWRIMLLWIYFHFWVQKSYIVRGATGGELYLTELLWDYDNINLTQINHSVSKILEVMCQDWNLEHKFSHSFILSLVTMGNISLAQHWFFLLIDLLLIAWQKFLDFILQRRVYGISLVPCNHRKICEASLNFIKKNK